MKAVIQRVKTSSVAVDGKTVGSIEKGLLILLGVTKEDTKNDAELMARKIANMRIFTDSEDKMNLSLLSVEGEALVISNFTLCADLRKGTRPSFDPAMSPDSANEHYEYFCNALEKEGIKNVQKGVFGAEMEVSIINDGPVTFSLDTRLWSKGNP